MSNVMMALGDYRFSVGTAAYQTLKRSSEYRWAEMNRIGRRPALQYVGLGTETTVLEGVVYPHFRGGVGQVESMRRAAEAGEPLLLVSGGGFFLGRWVIAAVEETGSFFLADGTPRKIEFHLTLKRYGDDFDHGADGRVEA